MSITLSKTETVILVAAASRPDGLIEFPPGMKASSRERLLGRFLKDSLATRHEDGTHSLTPAGYRAVGLRPPRKGKAASSVIAGPVSAHDQGAGTGRPGTKLALVRELLGRPDGATLVELTAATGWLPHTTRATLSRIRSAGVAIGKSARPDGVMSYRIEEAAGPMANGGREYTELGSASEPGINPGKRVRRRAGEAQAGAAA